MFQGRSDQEGFVLRSVSARGCQGEGVPELVLTQEQLRKQGHGLLVFQQQRVLCSQVQKQSIIVMPTLHSPLYTANQVLDGKLYRGDTAFRFGQL